MAPVDPIEAARPFWTEGMITAFFGGLALLITALTAGIVKILDMLVKLRQAGIDARAEGRAAGSTRERKLEAVASDVGKVKVMVDGAKSETLRELAALHTTIAKSGNPEDIARADEAVRRSHEQDERVRIAAELESNRAKNGEGNTE